ncbi:MAG: Mov34/MPN/PAD-1 family protein [Rhodospirillales bacterium]|nr:Mov34/MPN/PAD-1 family protein [Rhodospirillales bacterium]
MKLLIAKQKIEALRNALRLAGGNEIGGVLFGEHTGDAQFRVVELTYQHRQGDETAFRRRGRTARRELKRMSAKRQNDYKRFNYLGEWHSHPNALALPSVRDSLTIREILEHSDTNANFLVLLIVRLAQTEHLEMSAHAFLASGHTLECEIQVETGVSEQDGSP